MKKIPQVFYPDAAIKSAADDALGRKKFGEELAARLGAWSGKESLVVALYGPWGCGKSSVKNMALEKLRSAPATCPHIVEFNPWQISGEEQLTRAFFQEIAVQLGQLAGEDTKARARAEKWERYGELVQVSGSLARGAAQVMPFLGIPVAGLVAAAGEKMKTAGELAAHGKKAATAKDRTLSEVKGELRVAFDKGLKKSVLVVIDDIDRLTFAEIRLLFRLVKANADFPHFVYVLLFQKNTVVRALDEECGDEGEEYLEKIVQVGFDVPAVDRASLLGELGKGIDRILDRLNLKKRFSRERWTNVFFPALQHYFVSLRDVYRFLNVFSFSVSSLSTEDTLEVDPVDLIALEVLRVFEHEVYRAMPAAKGTLTHVGNDTSQRGLQERVISCLDGLKKPARQPERVAAILDHLFINLTWASGGMHFGSNFTLQWKRQLRLCHEDNFDRYFFLLVPGSDVSEREIEQFIVESGDRDKLVSRLAGWRSRNLIQAALGHLEAEPKLAKLADPLPYLTALHDTSDNLPEGIGVARYIQLGRVATMRTRALLKERDESTRLAILKSILSTTRGVFGPTNLARSEMRPKEPHPEQEPRNYLVSPAAAMELQALALENIRRAARDGRLAALERLEYVLSTWQEWAGPEEAKKWVSKFLETDAGAVQLLLGVMQTGGRQTLGSHYSKEVTYIRLENVEEFVDLGQLSAALKRVAKRNLNAREKIAVKAYDQALARRRSGKSADSILDGPGDDEEDE